MVTRVFLRTTFPIPNYLQLIGRRHQNRDLGSGIRRSGGEGLAFFSARGRRSPAIWVGCSSHPFSHPSAVTGGDVPLRPVAKFPWIFAVRHVPLRLVAVLFHVPIATKRRRAHRATRACARLRREPR